MALDKKKSRLNKEEYQSMIQGLTEWERLHNFIKTNLNNKQKKEAKKHRDLENKKMLPLSLKLLQLAKQYVYSDNKEDQLFLIELIHFVNEALNAHLKNRMNANSTFLYLLKKIHILYNESQVLDVHTEKPIVKGSNTLFSQPFNEKNTFAEKLNSIFLTFTPKSNPMILYKKPTE